MRPDLLRFARLQLRDAAAAEDAVQEALLGAIHNADAFAEQSSLKTWVFSILRHKLVDFVRSRTRVLSASELAESGSEEGHEGLFDTLFNARGHWHEATRPSPWINPDEALEQQQFWAVFEACLDQLPERTARVFSMRELLGLDTDEICKENGISPTNFWVLMHRARVALRACLDTRWFARRVERAS